MKNYLFICLLSFVFTACGSESTSESKSPPSLDSEIKITDLPGTYYLSNTNYSDGSVHLDKSEYIRLTKIDADYMQVESKTLTFTGTQKLKFEHNPKSKRKGIYLYDPDSYAQLKVFLGKQNRITLHESASANYMRE
jgi:hypothetical protein